MVDVLHIFTVVQHIDELLKHRQIVLTDFRA